MAHNVMLDEARDAIAQGQKSRARDLLTRLLRADQANPTYWLWMSAVVESAKERTFCLQNVLRLDPHNRAARLGLILAGQLPPDNSLQPEAVAPRPWTLPDEALLLKSRKEGTQRRSLVVFGMLGLLLLLAMFGGLGLRNSSSKKYAPLTVTPIYPTSTVTPSPLPSPTPRPRRTSVLRTSPTPLWMLLEATYTPTPLYVNTPHPISEAYRAGIRAFESGDYATMRNYMEQASRGEPASADLQYYVAEAFRLLNDPQAALVAYQKSIELDPLFAPAWLGKARMSWAIDPTQDILPDLQTAVEIDPNLVEAFLFRAQVNNKLGNYEAALDDLSEVEIVAPQTPDLYLFRAQAYLGMGDATRALENAQLARQLDQASLPAYLAVGVASLLSDLPAQAVEALKTYLLYRPDDASALSALGQAHYNLGADFPAAAQALNRSLEIQPEDFTALLYRGLVYLELKEGQLAVNDLFEARKRESQSFLATFGLGRGLFLTGRMPDAVSVITSSLELAETDQQLAQVYYWRAAVRRAEGDILLAASDWQDLLDLPESAVPAAWRAEAEQAILRLTPTASPTSTFTPATPTITKTASSPRASATISQKTGTPTPTRTPTLTKTPIPTKTPTPTKTPLPTRSPTPAKTSPAETLPP